MSLLARLAPTAALRAPGEPRVSNMELFFDLVYVFSIIQLSHYLLAHLSPLGALQAATVFAAVWWAWNYTAWATNWLDPDHPAGRTLVAFLMGCALLMAAAIPTAFTTGAPLFVGAYVTMALVRAFYMAAVFRGQQMSQNYAQLGVWSTVSAGFWIAGVFLPELRTGLWIAAVVIDYAAPFVGFWVPGAGPTPMESWPLAGLHLLERNQLVFIIALGESILLLGGTLVGTSLGLPYLGAAALGFSIIIAMWWLYFVRTTERGEHAFEHDPANAARLARAGLAYSHGIMVCGAIVVAVGIEMIIAHPYDAVYLSTVLVATVGPSLYLVGSALFERSVTGSLPVGHLLALPALAAVGGAVLLAHASGVVLGAAVLAVLVVLNVVATSQGHDDAPTSSARPSVVPEHVS
ncbi:low temperature requirement protein A [Rubrivirga sp.]|uniref:low temperature requirement protein A n=1 Tax=Rubrivirga sp. TaxID=1885344 RepID=UPI003C7764D8